MSISFTHRTTYTVTHILTQSYTLNVVYSHDDTQNMLHRNFRLLSDFFLFVFKVFPRK